MKKHPLNGRFQVVTFYFDSGTDEKLEYRKISDARKAVRDFWPDCDGYAIWDHQKKAYVRKDGAFPA